MIIELDFGRAGSHAVEISGVAPADYVRICEYFEPLVNASGVKSRDAIAGALQFAIRQCPRANPSDLYHHIIYRRYIAIKIGTNPEQSWVRASGEGFEIFLAKHYNHRLASYGLRLTPLTSGRERGCALERMGLSGRIGGSKIDVLVECEGRGRSLVSGFGVIGGLHAKASLAERVSDDIPASRIMMGAGFLSILATLDVKSFPPPHGDLVNRGELGTVENPSDKRRYVEEHGDFSVCFSYNYRSRPSPGSTPSGRRIEIVDPSQDRDKFVAWLVDAAPKVG